jgi:AcrR family transcriptional regulator
MKEAQATRAAVVEAARLLWSSKGFFATSTLEIVQAAGVGTRGAMYAHFADRDELFLAVFEDVHRRLTLQLAEHQDVVGDPLTRLRLVLLAFLDITATAPDVQVLLVEGPAVLGIKRWHQAEADRGLPAIESRLAEAISVGVVDDQAVRPLARILLMLVNETALMIAAAEDPIAARDEAGAALSQLVDGLRTRRAARA